MGGTISWSAKTSSARTHEHSNDCSTSPKKTPTPRASSGQVPFYQSHCKLKLGCGREVRSFDARRIVSSSPLFRWTGKLIKKVTEPAPTSPRKQRPARERLARSKDRAYDSSSLLPPQSTFEKRFRRGRAVPTPAPRPQAMNISFPCHQASIVSNYNRRMLERSAMLTNDQQARNSDKHKTLILTLERSRLSEACWSDHCASKAHLPNTSS